MSKPVAFIDLFAGMGGFTTGAIDAGAVCIVSVDSWSESNRVHKANHPHVPTLNLELGHPSHWRIFKRMVDEWRRMGYHVHIPGSPPCQALSNASRRSPEEGMPLVMWYLDLVKKCEPDSWSMENVVPMRKRLPEGTPSVVLNSADFGVPQTRRRCYAGAGWEAEPTHTKEGWVSVIESLPHLTDELDDLIPAPSMTEQYRTASKDKPYPTVTSQSPHQLKLLMDSGRASAKTTGVNPATGKKEGGSGPLFRELSDPSYTVMTNPRRIMLEATGSNAKRSADTPLGSPSKTLCGSGNQVGPRMFDHEQEKPAKIRSLTLPETLVLQGFPADYDLSAATTQKARWTMVGNAVPPPVAAAVIRGIQNGVQ